MSLNSQHSSFARLTRIDGRCRFPVSWFLALLSISFSSMALLSGCGSSLTTKAGAISVTYPSGVTPGQLPVLSTATVTMMPVNDKANYGVDWTLTCGGDAQTGYTTTGCGTLLPSHTADGSAATYTAPGVIPANITVTLTARVTSDPSQQSSVTITIVNQAIIVTLSTTPASLAVGGTTPVTATITNDINTEGVNWTATCGSSSYGSFNPTQTQSTVGTTYTAPVTVPSCGTVTITATSVADSTKSASATITILPITVSVSPSTFNVTTSGTETLRAQVTNDVEGAGVTWSCGSSPGCGSFSPTKTASGGATTYTAPSTVPSGGTVTITATSANDKTTNATAVATISASSVITVNLTTSLASLAEDKSATLKATVTGDSSNAGVDWTATCGSSVAGACGTFSSANTASGAGTTYTAPSSLPPDNPVTITATSHAYNLNPSLVANPASVTLTITAPESIAFTQQPASSVATNGTASVSAYVTNDAATGGGITWTVQCTNTADGACGYIKPYQTANGATATYVAPPVSPGVSVNVKATSTALSSATALSTAITIVASTTHSISFIPFAPSRMQVDTSVNLVAAVTNDSSNSGVDWSVCGNGCGFFTTQPAQAAIAAVPPSAGYPGSPAVPAVAAVTATSVQGWPNGLPLPYTAPAVAPEGGVVITASSTADRLNDVTSPATATSTIAISSDATGPELHGVVQAGAQPVVGASIYLYAAGTSGYASASIPISSPAATSAITTDSTGGFTIPAGYSCPQLTSQVYLVASGGQVGSAGVNSNLALMTALGTCSNLSSTTIVVNEVTTVASAAALATFSADNVETGELSYQYIGSSSANSTVGLTNAFASINNLVDITTGQPKFSTVAGNATAPYVTINTLADALNACAVTSGGADGDGTVCGNLFAYTDPVGEPSYAPTDTLQAIFDLLKPPSPNISGNGSASSVFGLASLSSPYQPISSSAPDEWSLSLHYTSGGGFGGSGTTASGSSALAVDASGNIWITNQSINSVSEWSGLGAAYSPDTSGSTPGGFTGRGIYAPAAVAVDPSGYIWIVNGNGTLTKLDSLGTTVTGSTFSGGGLSSEGTGIAIDGSGNIWVTSSGSPGSVAKFNSSGTAQSPSTGYTSGIDDPSVIAIDGSGNVWVYNQSSNGGKGYFFVKLNNANGSLMIGGGGGSGPPQLAIDKSGNLWFGGRSGGTGYGFGEISADYNGTNGVQVNTITGNYFVNPEGMAFDGSNRLWVASAGGNDEGKIISPNLSLYDPANSNSSNNYVDTNFSNGAPSVAVDASGNVWVLSGNNTVAEYVGLATPVVTPLSVGVKNNKLGTKP